MQLQMFRDVERQAVERVDHASGALTTDAIDELILSGAPVAVGVSGGSDSQGAALATFAYLDAMGHAGPRILVHADLGRVEWDQSIVICHELAERLGVELVVVRRAAGGLMERWLSRWESSKRRYRGLSTVTLVLPWSGPKLRFCTSELKASILAAELRRRFKGQTIINVTGVRRDESRDRARRLAAEPDCAFSTQSTPVWAWRPIAHWTKAQTFDAAAAAGLRIHPGYTDYKMSRISCRFCVLGSGPDLAAAAATDEAAPLYEELVQLEIDSTFGFQGARWLGDVAPDRLPVAMRAALVDAKARAMERRRIESAIPKELLYVKGWPTRMPTPAEATLLASVRAQVRDVVRIPVDRIDAESVLERYAELLEAKRARQSAGCLAEAA